MSKNKLAEAKLNAYVANCKADSYLTEYGLNSVEKGVVLSKVVLRAQAFKHQTGVPFYAFVKQAGQQAVMVDVVSGSTRAIPNHLIAAKANVRGRFKIDGITYDKADTIHGMPRYKVVGSKAKPRGAKFTNL